MTLIGLARGVLSLSRSNLVRRGIPLFLASLLLLGSASAQTGLPAWATYGGGQVDHIDLANLQVHFTIPILSKRGNGLPLRVTLKFDDPNWTGGTAWYVGWPGFGLDNAAAQIAGVTSYGTATYSCFDNVRGKYDSFPVYEYFQYVDPSGVDHLFLDPTTGNTITTMASYPRNCDPGDNPGYPINASGAAADGSGYTVSVHEDYATVHAPDGTEITMPPIVLPGQAFQLAKDGGTITATGSGSNLSVTDTLGVTALTVSGSAASGAVTYAYPGAGGTANIVVHFASETVESALGCGKTEYPPTAKILPTSIDLPDGTSYQFGYHAVGGGTDGRIASIGLPSGGQIAYSYGATNCGDGGPESITRTVSANGVNSVTTYTRSGNQTQVLDPAGNLAVYTFNGTYQSERQVYNGASATPANLLLTTQTCFNGDVSSCSATAPSGAITTVDREVTLPGGQHRETYTELDNQHGGPSEVDESDWTTGGSEGGGVLRKTLTAYASYALPASVTVENAGGQVAAQTTYTYQGDEPLTIQTATGATTLTRSFTYNTNGTVATATDVNGAVTNYHYDGAGGCDNALPTSVVGPTGLTTTVTWNCDGGVLLTSEDSNNGTTTWTYSDPHHLWRPSQVQDPAGNVTDLTYTPAGGSSPGTTESSETFAGGSATADVLTTFDGLGRPMLSQKRQAPGSSSFDSVETYYDADGRAYKTSAPYVAGAGVGYAGSVFTTATFDGLGRPLVSTNAAGGTVTDSYNGNDTLITRSGSPAAGKQLEYNGLGELTSVCEITSTDPGNGACGQTNAENGYLTQYGYSTLGQIVSVDQDAQPNGAPLARSFVFDELGRLTQEVNPESGTTSFVYDTDATCGTSKGDIVKRTDAMGNVTCYGYDALHRLTGVTYPSGLYAAVTPAKTFVYDSSSVDGIALADTQGRMVEAYTGSASSKTTDEVFSYGQLGYLTDAYELTPSSGGWYHVSQSYFPNGAPHTLSMSPGVFPAMTFGLSGQGQMSTVSAASGQNPVTDAVYDQDGFGELDSIALGSGSGDQDAYTYNPGTGQMTQYQFSVNGSTDTGKPGWNANGTLQQVQITDNIPGATDSQTCNYTQDDLGRIAGVNCGAALTENFSFDAFGNVKSNGSSISGIAFSAAGYANNRISGQTYDADGNLKDDPVTPAAGVNSFDAEGKPVVLEGVPVVYDALGRAVEAARPDGTMEFVYAPSGDRLALMSGQSVVVAKIGLPGGGVAEYNGSGLQAYGHADRLGNIPLFSTPARGLFMSAAYTPYGADYDQAGGATWRVFTGKSQDIDWRFSGGQYDFPEREYNSIQGRWWTPDPSGLAAVNPNNPQSWNAYAYVGNTPLVATDPLGLDCNNLSQMEQSGNCTITVSGDSTQISLLPGSPGAGSGSGWPSTGADPESPNCSFWGQYYGTCGSPPTKAQCVAMSVTGNCPMSQPSREPSPLPPAPPITTTAPHSRLQCFEDAAKEDGLALGLDTASLIVDGAGLGPEKQYAKLLVGLGLSTGATINSAVHQDAGGAVLGMTSYLKTTMEMATKGLGWGWAKYIPYAGVFADLASTVNDISQTVTSYNSCLAN